VCVMVDSRPHRRSYGVSLIDIEAVESIVEISFNGVWNCYEFWLEMERSSGDSFRKKEKIFDTLRKNHDILIEFEHLSVTEKYL